MQFLGMVALAITFVSGNPAAQPAVLACMNPGVNAAVVLRAHAYADRLIDEIGMKLRWRPGARQSAAVPGLDARSTAN